GDDKLTIVIQDSDIREVLELLSEQGQLNILPSQNVQGTVSASLTKVDVRTALAAILRSTGYVMQQEGDFIFVGTPDDMQSMERLHDQVGTRIYRLKYIRAAEVQTLITPMLSEGVGTISISTESKIGIAPDSSNPGSDDYAGVETVFVRDYEQNLKKIDKAVLEIDCRPLQVAIEAMILSVQLDDSLDMGVSFEALRQNNHIRLLSGFPPQNLASLDLDEGGLKLGYLDANLSLFVEALETVGETNVIAAPQLLVLNKQRAEILIGEQKGYISTTVTETASTQSVEFLE
ncbi:hofQ, partial [Symbiodinium microadriaticum]